MNAYLRRAFLVSVKLSHVIRYFLLVSSSKCTYQILQTLFVIIIIMRITEFGQLNKPYVVKRIPTSAF